MRKKCDILLSGVGGQGVLSASIVIASSGLLENLRVKQSETHGMSQRGGAVMTHLRLSNVPIASDLIPTAGADLILSMEPLESLRYVSYLSREGTLITATNPIVNIPNYPDLDGLMTKIASLPSAIMVDCDKLAREAGSAKATNMVLVGAASHKLPLAVETLERLIEDLFKRKGDAIVETNLKAFHLGRQFTSADSNEQIEAQGG